VVHFGELANLTIEACVSPRDDPVDEAVSLGSTNICVAIGAEGTRPNPAAVGVGRVRLRSTFDLADKEVPVFRSDRPLNRSKSTELFLSGGLGFRLRLGLGLGLGRVAGWLAGWGCGSRDGLDSGVGNWLFGFCGGPACLHAGNLALLVPELLIGNWWDVVRNKTQIEMGGNPS